MIEKYISTWFSQLACTGVCTKMIRLSRRCSRATERLPRCDEPLSTIRNNRSASQYGSLIQYLRHHAPKRPTARSPFATAHHDAAMHVPGCQVLQGALAFIFRFDASRSTPPWRLLWVPALPCLDARLLIT